MIRTSRTAVALLLAVSGAALLGGCSTDSSKPVTDYAGEPKGVDAPASSAGGASWAAWLEQGRQFGIVLYGSSNCPPTVQSIQVTAGNQLQATLAPVSGGVCTQDYVPHTTVFATPARLSKTSGVTIGLSDATVTLAGLRG
ncbi:hypothetical protein ATY41_11260 [Leifsonia xyli subsp. xyli]|uniref:Secreted protein n=2 Tax=Leifsonia xyli subsp. xyli TaxID=59736 RepID=Q6ACR3_LEIXX|nr:hypothetical protein [Leifsonia xyli]AAT89830.1 hypothetical protein Lxx21350 [Leifsonia xyli subsp. xyli str. CTCB07]ODA90167.1 hypothetical protein ATY41_11260 [Leifsonia xyli subsp. xyli]